MPRTYSAQDLHDKARLSEMTHQEIADRVGVSRQTVTDTLAGRSRHPATRYAIARVLGVDPGRVRWDEEAA